MKNKNIRKRSIGILIVLLFLISFLTPFADFSKIRARNVTGEEQVPNLSTNYLFQGTAYTFNLDDFYDDEDLYKVYTGAKFQTEVFDGEDWSGVVNNDTVTPVDNNEVQYGDPGNINMIKGTTDSADNMKVNDASYTTFTSTHTDGYIREMPHQWDNFTFTEGSGDTIGEIETIDADYSVMRHNGTSGNYPATYSFKNEIDGTSGTDIDFIDADASPENTGGIINAQIGGHTKVLEIFDNNAVSGPDLTHNIDSPQTYGTIEFWMRTTDVAKTSVIYISDGGGYAHSLNLYFFNSFFRYYDTAMHSIAVAVSHTWYHIRIDFEMTAGGYEELAEDRWQVYINDVLHGPYAFRGTPSEMDSITFYQDAGPSGYSNYYDAFGYSWDTNYAIGDNLYPDILELDVQVDMQVTDEDLSSIEYFKYSHKTNISATIDLDIWNWDTSVWFEIESIDNFANFDDDSFTLGSSSNYVSGTNQVRIRFQASSSSSDFELQIDRFRLDYLTIPAELEMTISFLFVDYNEDLLAMNVQSWQKTNISQTITFKIWNYNTESWVQISSSSETSFTKKEYNTESPSNFISSNGVVKLNWTGSDTLNDFELHIDYLFIQIFYKLDLVYSKSFDTNGIYRYRWAVLGSIQYTQWVVFEVVDPVPNFHAISESDVTTRWILQNATLTPTENFTDDISGSNWNLYDVSEDYFKEIPTEITNYLLDNYTDVYTGTHWDVGVQDSAPDGITWDGTNFWVNGRTSQEVYKYNAAGVYQDIHFDVSGYGSSATDIYWDGTFFWILDNANDEVYQYNAAGVYTFVHWNVGGQLSLPTGITWDGTYWWVIGSNTDEVFKYTATGVYTGVHFDVSTEDTKPQGITWDGTYFWIVGQWNDEVYKYTSTWTYTGEHFDVGTEDGLSTGITWDGTYFWIVGHNSEEIYKYTKDCTIFKKYQGSGYMYMQTNTTELISLKSTVYGTNYTLSSGDYFEVDFQTSSDSLINLILLKDGSVNKTLTLSPSSNSNFNNQTVQISVDEDVEFDQLKISSTFEDKDYVKVYDIKTKKYIVTGDHADFCVGSKRDYGVYLTPDIYNLRISENNIEVINENVTIPTTGVKQYVYTPESPISKIKCRLTLFPVGGGLSLTFTDYEVYINRSYNGYYNEIPLLEPIFEADELTTVYISVYDRFGLLIKSSSEPIADFINFYIEVFQLEIINLMLQKTTININESYYFEIASGRWINFMLSKRYYQIGYFDPNNVYKQFIIKLDSNQVYELNRSRICNIYYTNQRMEPLSFYQFKTYINGTRIINNMFYATDGAHRGIEVKDLSDISVLNYTYVEGTQEYNQVSLILTQYSLKVMSLQLNFNHINITRNPVYYTSSYYWSEWLGPRETAEYFLFPGYYVINITNYEDGGWSKYDYTLNGDDYILIGSNNTIYNVLVNIANVNATIGNQITNVQIDLTNQNSNINNTIINIEINLGNINSTLGSFLVNIDTAISNINSSIISEIVSLGVNIDNVNSSLSNQMLTINTDISNLDSSIQSQFITLGVDISNINGSIVNQILALGVDITNINTSLSNQILSLEVDIENIDALIIEQILLVIADIENIETVIDDQTLVILADITNLNSTLLNQMVSLGVDITNINATIYNQILSLQVDLTNINSSITSLLTNIGLNILNLESDINTLYLFTNTSIWNLNSAMNSSFIYLENNIYSINQSISTLVIGIDNSISLVNATITSMFTEMNQQFIVVQSTLDYSFAFLNQSVIQLANTITENHVILYNLIEQRANEIDSSLINIQTLINLVNNTVADESLVIQTLVNLIGTNITNNHIIINNLLNLIDNNITNNNIQLVSILEVIGNNITTNHFVIQTLLDVIGNNITNNHIEILTNLNIVNTTISQNQIELINRLLFINNTINDMMFELTNQLLFLNGTIYSAVLNLSTSVEFGVDMVIGNITITYQQNEFLTELYKQTMFSQLLNWSGVAYNYTLMEDRIDVWDFINNYKNQSIEIHLRYGDLIDKLTVSAQNNLLQYLPKTGAEYREWSEELQEYIGDWKPLPDNKTVDFGFYDEEVPDIPSFDNTSITIVLIILIFIGVISLTTYLGYKYNKRVQRLKVAYARQHSIDKDIIKAVSGRSSRMSKIK